MEEIEKFEHRETEQCSEEERGIVNDLALPLFYYLYWELN